LSTHDAVSSSTISELIRPPASAARIGWTFSGPAATPMMLGHLELHRFDLYRAPAVPVPKDSDEERTSPLPEWRHGTAAR
jgi:hypothetical protein